MVQENFKLKNQKKRNYETWPELSECYILHKKKPKEKEER